MSNPTVDGVISPEQCTAVVPPQPPVTGEVKIGRATVTELCELTDLIDIGNVASTDDCCTPAPVTSTCCTDSTSYECTEDNKVSVAVKPYSLPFHWLKSKPVSKLKIFGNVKQILSRLTGTGYLHQDEEGYTSLVPTPPMKATKLLHEFNRSSITEKTLLGDPLPSDFDTVATDTGDVYLQRGLADNKSIKVYDPETQTFGHVALSQLPTCFGEQLPSSDKLELVGLQPIPSGGNASDERCMQRLLGEGMLIAKKEATVSTNLCDCEACQTAQTTSAETTVFEFLPSPSVASILVFDPITGYQWVDPTGYTALQGPDGERGLQGERGLSGYNGNTGRRGGVDCEVTCGETIVEGIAQFPTDPADGTIPVYYNTTTFTTRQWNGTGFDDIDTNAPPQIPQFPVPPIVPTDYPVYYNTTDEKLYQYNGSDYVSMDIDVGPDLHIYTVAPTDNGDAAVYWDTTLKKFMRWDSDLMTYVPIDDEIGVPEFPSDPVGPDAPSVYYNTTTNTTKQWNGSEYEDIGIEPELPVAPTLSGIPGVNIEENTLNWTASPTATGYKLYAGVTLLADTTLLTFIDSSVVYDVSYSYKVVAYNATGDAPDSNIVTLTPTAPS